MANYLLKEFPGEMLLNQNCSDGKEKGVAISRNSLISKALQDGLGFKKMKSLETFGNCKKLKYR